MKTYLTVLVLFFIGVILVFAEGSLEPTTPPPRPGLDLNAKQVRINGVVFTIGVNTYNADRNAIFNGWYKEHTSVENVQLGDDVSWITDFTRNYKLEFPEGNLIINDTVVGGVRVISFSSGGRTMSGAALTTEHWLVYAANTGVLIGAQLQIFAVNAFFRVNTGFFDMKEFVFPLWVDKLNEPVSNVNTESGLITYKNVFNNVVHEYLTNGVNVSIYTLYGEAARKLKEADDFAKAMGREIPVLIGKLTR